MATLGSILRRAQERKALAGSYSAELSEALRAHRKQQLITFIAIELFLVIGIAFCAYYLVRNPANKVQEKLLAGLIGIGAGGGIEAIRRIWSQWSQTTLLLLLIPESSPAQLSAIVERLAKKLS